MQLPKWQNLPLNCSTSQSTSCPECTNFSHSASSCGLKHSILQHFFSMVRIELPAVQKSHSESLPCQVDTWKMQIHRNVKILRHHLLTSPFVYILYHQFVLHLFQCDIDISGRISEHELRGASKASFSPWGGRWKNVFTKQETLPRPKAKGVMPKVFNFHHFKRNLFICEQNLRNGFHCFHHDSLTRCPKAFAHKGLFAALVESLWNLLSELLPDGAWGFSTGTVSEGYIYIYYIIYPLAVSGTLCADLSGGCLRPLRRQTIQRKSPEGMQQEGFHSTQGKITQQFKAAANPTLGHDQSSHIAIINSG